MENTFKALVFGIDPAGALFESLKQCLKPHFVVLPAGTAPQAHPDIVFVAQLEPTRGHPQHAGISRSDPVPVMALLDSTEVDEILDVLGDGITDFVLPPFTRGDILPRALRLVKQHRERNTPERLKETFGMRMMVGSGAAFSAVVKNIPNVAKCDATVLLSGETGTGKEVCARAVHYLSPRAAKPFVPVNCGAIPADLTENELFGHERGAYTHAMTAEEGVLGEAEGGTLFLDEIDSLPLHAQVKLLRFLQEKEYRPVGSRKTRTSDVRVIAALNSEPEEAIVLGKLRKDLYYRLNVIYLKLPPLRDRSDDIPALARHFIEKYSVELHRRCTGISDEAMTALMSYSWPGNVRELEHAIHRAMVISDKTVIGKSDLFVPQATDAKPGSFRSAKAAVVEDFERTYIRKLLHSHNGNISRAAEAAQKNRRAFWQLIRKHHIDVREFRNDSTRR